MSRIKDVVIDLMNIDPHLVGEFAMLMNKNDGELPPLCSRHYEDTSTH